MTCLASDKVLCKIRKRYLGQGDNRYDGSLCYGCPWDGYHQGDKAKEAVRALPAASLNAERTLNQNLTEYWAEQGVLDL